MFSSFTGRLKTEVETLKVVLDTHDRLRVIVFPTASSGESTAEQTETSEKLSEVVQQLAMIRQGAPSKSSWQVYDHCAAFTRLYAVYEQFVEDLVSDYLRLLPALYPSYEELHPNVTKQHRIGIGQILLKLGKDGPYKDLEEREIIRDLSNGLLGNPNYVLLRDAFLIDPQNYRAEALAKLFSYLGFEDPWAWIQKHPLMLEFMQNKRDANETPRTLLHDFVEYRNKASHTLVGDIVAIDEIKSIADFIVVLSETLSQLVMRQVVQRKKAIGQAIAMGVVIHRFSNQIVGVRANAGTISVGDEVIVFQRHTCHKAIIESIEFDRIRHEQLVAKEGQEIGVKLNDKVNEGAQLLKLAPAEPAGATEAPSEPLSPDDFPISSEPQPDDAVGGSA